MLRAATIRAVSVVQVQEATDHGRRTTDQSFIPQRFHRVGQGRFDGLVAHRQQRNTKSRHTTDFRSVYASIAEQWLNVRAQQLLEGEFVQLPLFA